MLSITWFLAFAVSITVSFLPNINGTAWGMCLILVLQISTFLLLIFSYAIILGTVRNSHRKLHASRTSRGSKSTSSRKHMQKNDGHIIVEHIGTGQERQEDDQNIDSNISQLQAEAAAQQQNKNITMQIFLIVTASLLCRLPYVVCVLLFGASWQLGNAKSFGYAVVFLAINTCFDPVLYFFGNLLLRRSRGLSCWVSTAVSSA